MLNDFSEVSDVHRVPDTDYVSRLEQQLAAPP